MPPNPDLDYEDWEGDMRTEYNAEWEDNMTVAYNLDSTIPNPTCEELDRAELLADTLDKVAVEYPENFDMNAWIDVIEFGMEKGDAPKMERHRLGEHPNKCGTTGCALGWAPFALGIAKDNTDRWDDYAARVMGIHNPLDFEYLFQNFKDPDVGEKGAKAAAGRIREWVEHNRGNCVEE